MFFSCGDSRTGQGELPVVVVGGGVFVRPLDDLVAKSRTNNLGRY